MASGAPVAVGIGVGYVLGRNHKFRWALILGTAAATGRLGGLSTQAIERGTEMLRANPDLAKLTDGAMSLLQAGRSAAVSAMTSRAESMTGALGDKAQALGSAGGKVTKGDGRKNAEGSDDAAGRGNGKRRDQDTDDEQDEYDQDDEYEDEDDEYEDEDEGAEEEPEESQPAAPGRAGRGSGVRRTGTRR